jgi:hypothetical protein
MQKGNSAPMELCVQYQDSTLLGLIAHNEKCLNHYGPISLSCDQSIAGIVQDKTFGFAVVG